MRTYCVTQRILLDALWCPTWEGNPKEIQSDKWILQVKGGNGETGRERMAIWWNVQKMGEEWELGRLQELKMTSAARS